MNDVELFQSVVRRARLRKGRPALSGKIYKTQRHAEAAAEYLNRFGVQSRRYQWEVKRVWGGWELWTIPRSEYDARPEAILN